MKNEKIMINDKMKRIKSILQNIAMTLMFLLSLSNMIGLYIWRVHPFGYTRTMSYYKFVAPLVWIPILFWLLCLDLLGF